MSVDSVGKMLSMVQSVEGYEIRVKSECVIGSEIEAYRTIYPVICWALVERDGERTIEACVFNEDTGTVMPMCEIENSWHHHTNWNLFFRGEPSPKDIDLGTRPATHDEIAAEEKRRAARRNRLKQRSNTQGWQ